MYGDVAVAATAKPTGFDPNPPDVRMKRKSTSVSFTDITTPVITPSPAKKINNNDVNPRRSQQLSASTTFKGTAPQHRPRARIVAGRRLVVASRRRPVPGRIVVGHSGESRRRGVVGVGCPAPRVTTALTYYNFTPTQLGPDELGASVITIDNGPNAEVYTIEFGGELIKLLNTCTQGGG